VRALGRDFQAWRAAWDARHERVAMGYATEGAEHRAADAAPTFRSYLVMMTGAAWPMSGSVPARSWRAAA
jgi:hypothetical protein